MRYYTHTLYGFVTVAEIPKEEISRVDFAAAKQPRETLGDYYKRQTEKPALLCNAGFFSMADGTPCFGQIDEGVTRVEDSGHWGFGVAYGEENRLAYGSFSQKLWKDFISGYPVLVRDGTVCSPFRYAQEIDYTAARMAVGYGDTSVVFAHVGKPGMRLAALARLMRELGCRYAINLDGGGSARMMVRGAVAGKPLENRRVDSVMAVYLKAEADKETNPYPVPTSGVLLRRKLGYQEGVKWLQYELTRRGYDTGGVDGHFGKKTEGAVKAYQRSVGLSVDGLAGRYTIGKLKEER